MKNFKKVFAVLAACTMAAGMIGVAACTPEETPGPGGDNPGIVAPVEVSVTVNPTTKSIEAEQTFEITATVTNSDKNPAWDSSNKAVATVAGSGKTVTVTAVAEGTANITATVDGKTATCAVTVTAKPVVADKLELDKDYVMLENSGDKATATLTATNIGDGVTFTSSDPEVVTVSNEGGVATLTAVKLGAVTITAASGTTEKTCKVEVANAGLVYTIESNEEGDDVVYIKDGETKVSGELRIPAYYYDDVINEAYLPVVQIAENGFINNTDITSVYLGDNLLSTGVKSFQGCKGLVSAKCGPALNVLEAYTFDGCTALASFDWGESQPTRIVRCAFSGGVLLTEFTVPATVIGFGDSCFNNAQQLETVKIYGPIDTIYTGTFMNCVALTKIYIPETVKSIGDTALYNYSEPNKPNLTVYFAGTEAQWGEMSIGNANQSIDPSHNSNFKIEYEVKY